MSWHTLALLSQRVRQNEMGSKEKLPIIVFFLFLVPKDFWITRLSNILAVRVPAQAYSRNTSCTLNLISAFLLLFLLKSSGWDKVLLSQISFINIVLLLSHPCSYPRLQTYKVESKQQRSSVSFVFSIKTNTSIIITSL
jgi:hypothetical protein